MSEVTLTNTQLESLIHKMKTASIQQSISLQAQRKPTSVFHSKLGGVPYLPPDFEYPHNTSASSDQQPLKLLAQLNFEELPKIANYPQKGILQFYIAYEKKDTIYGLNFDDLTKQTNFRVVYHKHIIEDESVLQHPPEITSLDKRYFPFTGEFLLTGLEQDDYMSPHDYRFNDLCAKKLEKVTGIQTKCVPDLSQADYDKIHEELGNDGHKIGGYPAFTQGDPREDAQTNHEMLLLQIDTDFENDYQIIWGDSGVANFFIQLNDLKNLDFSNVMYTWDCY